MMQTPVQLEKGQQQMRPRRVLVWALLLGFMFWSFHGCSTGSGTSKPLTGDAAGWLACKQFSDATVALPNLTDQQYADKVLEAYGRAHDARTPGLADAIQAVYLDLADNNADKVFADTGAVAGICEGVKG